LNKLQLNDLLKQHLKDIKVHDIQLSRSGIFTIYASDVNPFNRILNEFTSILAANDQALAIIYVPRSIQQIQYTEKVSFVKRVDLELPEDRIAEALKQVGFNIEHIIRLKNKEKNYSTQIIRITFNDSQKRSIFIQTGLQIDSMQFPAEPAMQNIKPVQCYTCVKFNHVTTASITLSTRPIASNTQPTASNAPPTASTGPTI